MVTREEAAKKVNEQFSREFIAAETNTCWHYGLVELRELFDFIYGGKPTTEAENIKGDS